MSQQGSLDVEKQPMGNEPSVNQPSSGTYGEGVALDRLKAALPPVPPPEAAGQNPPPPMAPGPIAPPPGQEGRPPGPATPPGMPSGLLAPTQQPHVPVSTPLQGTAPAANALTEAQHRLQILDQLTNDPNVSDTTRRWAAMVRRVIIGG